MQARGIDAPDFVLVTGDAYVDHPSFGVAIIARVLEAEGYSVCILAQPEYNNPASFQEFGRPRLAFMVTGGNIDSMVNHYTVAKKRRAKDFYSAGGIMGGRPDRASIVYSQKIRTLYKDVPIILGGIEASLRRLAHYDYWDDRVRRSVLHDSGADLLTYGMGERATREIAARLAAGCPVDTLTDIRGTAYKRRDLNHLQNKDDYIELPSYQEICADKRRFAQSFLTQYQNTEPKTAKMLVEYYDEGYVIQNIPAEILSEEEMDVVYRLPFARDYHPAYRAAGGVPAIEEVKFSLTSVRGCFGACNFCALSFHQGRIVQPRSHASIVAEAKLITEMADFKGYIHDVGGPTANFRSFSCAKQKKEGTCTQRKCLVPKPCRNLQISHSDYLSLLEKLRKLPKVKKVFVRSGIRFDYLIYDKDKSFFKALCKNHVSGQLKVAPEHISNTVLEKMGKPSKEVFERFSNEFYKISKEAGLKQFLVPYLMSSHPGSDLTEAVALAEYLKQWGYTPEQVQDFYPTPSTISTCMYYTGLDPFTMTPVYVAKDPKEKAMQRALIQYRLPQNYELVLAALKKADRMDLVGYDKDCLIRPRGAAAQPRTQKPKERPQGGGKGRGQAGASSGARGTRQAAGKTAGQAAGQANDPAPTQAPKPKKKKKTIRNVHKKKG